MTSVRREITIRLDKQGWQRAEAPDVTLDWWAEEVWLLQSLWSPQDCQVYLTFVIDPQWEGPRIRGEGVWAVSASVGTPDPRGQARLSLGKGWRERVPEFFSALAGIRHLWQEAEPSVS